MTRPDLAYAEAVLSGEILACRWVKLACKRHLDDLEHGEERGLYFDVDAAKKALDFFSFLRLWKGSEYKGKEFVLGPHLQFITFVIFGWKWIKTDYRRFKTAYIEMARKGAKSTYAGGVGAYMFVADGEHGAEVYCAATKKEQAKIVWTNIRNLTRGTMFERLITYYNHNLSCERFMSKCEPLSSDVKSLDGLDTHFASLDELHAHPTPQVFDLIADSTGTRSQPLILIITTAGFDQAGVCYQKREYLTQILKRTVEDDSFFGIIFTLDTKKDWPELKSKDEYRRDPTGEQEDDWTNEDCWIKAMPGLCGVTENGVRYGLDEDDNALPGYMTKIEDVRDKARYAKQIPAAQNNFLTKRMNIWTQQANRWLSLELWDKCNKGEIDPEAFRGRRCYAGIDLASTQDLTSVVYLFPSDDFQTITYEPKEGETAKYPKIVKRYSSFDVFMRCFCPEDRLYDMENKYKEQYQGWEKQGFLTVTPGNSLDFEAVRRAVIEDDHKFQIIGLGYDRLFQGYEFGQVLADKMRGKNQRVFPVGMGWASLGVPCFELELALLKGSMNHGGNPILRWMADNTVVKEHSTGYKAPDKANSQAKIDGIIALLISMHVAQQAPEPIKIRMPMSV